MTVTQSVERPVREGVGGTPQQQPQQPQQPQQRVDVKRRLMALRRW